MSLHGITSQGSVNQTIVAPAAPNPPPGDDEFAQSVGSSSYGSSMLAKLRYQLGGPQGYGYLQLDVRNQNIVKDDSALLTSFTPAGFGGGGGNGGDLVSRGVFPSDEAALGGYQSFAGTMLGAHQSNYGFDAQLPMGGEKLDGAPATMLLLSHQTSINAQSVSGPGAQTQPYLYNQHDQLGDDWLEIDHRFPTGLLSFKYDLGTESLTTNYVQGGAHADLIPAPAVPAAQVVPADQGAPVNTLGLGQTQRSAVLRYNGDPTSHIHYSVAGYYSNFSTFGTSFDPRAGVVWTPTGNTAIRASLGTTYQVPQLSALIALPPAARVPIGGVIFIGNPNLKPDHATEYDLGGEQLFGRLGHQLRLSADLYQSNLRAPANQLVVEPIPHCQSDKHPHLSCPLSYPVNAGSGIYRGLDIRAEQELGNSFRLRAGWSVDSSFLTAVPPDIQDGTLVTGQQSLGQPLQKGYLGFERDVREGLVYGAQLNYQGLYNELNRSPFATVDAHIAYRRAGYEFGLYGTNLTNAYAAPFTVVGGGLSYGALPGQPMIATDALVLQGAKVVFVFTKSI
jgi:outer membrane receptor protein involved in Fe transport